MLQKQQICSKMSNFARMDADDMMMPHRLEQQINVLRGDTAIDVVGSEAVIIGEHDELLGKRDVNPNVFRTPNDYFRSARFIHPTIMGRLAWFRKWRYSNEMSGNEDLDLWIRSHGDSTFLDIDEPLLFYRDPYKFRLNVFLFRQHRYFKCVWKLRHHMTSQWFLAVCVSRSIASSLMAVILTIIGQEKKMISKRNILLGESAKEKYEELLKRIRR